MSLVHRFEVYGAFARELSLSPRSEWQIAIRRRGEKTLYEGNAQGFRCVSNTVRYWYADPFLFCHNGQDYLFVEMFDRWKGKGVIGVCKVRHGRCDRFRICLELPWHLSYPCVFENESGIHTYNASCAHEVIDLKIPEPRYFASFVQNFKRHMARKFKAGGDR